MKVSVPLRRYLWLGFSHFSADHTLMTSWLVGFLCAYFSIDLLTLGPDTSSHKLLGFLGLWLGVLNIYHILQHVHERIKLSFIIDFMLKLDETDDE